MGNILKWIIAIPLLILLTIAVIYIGSCVYGNFIENPIGQVEGPGIDKAEYIVTIKNTGNSLLTDKYEQIGDVYLLSGYWELVGNKYQYRNRDITLDKSIYGEITIRKRE